MENTFGTVINCMDGRAQLPMIKKMRETFQVQHVDMITEPGPNKIIADQSDKPTMENIKKRLDISVHNHESSVIAIAGHHDCAGNPTTVEEQKKHLQKAKAVVQEWYPKVEVVTYWLNDRFEVEEV
ncbi:carbonic anhydrase [Caldalkalibacillus salinus]|uniref:carbonic anhydrase n=1 Tax=Caldalkalibacillus salinus TaxID=2803787 RepID=UPI0019224C37|nr:carbonic anhydrase [Caldalkalibacillus salinus]